MTYVNYSIYLRGDTPKIHEYLGVTEVMKRIGRVVEKNWDGSYTKRILTRGLFGETVPVLFESNIKETRPNSVKCHRFDSVYGFSFEWDGGLSEYEKIHRVDVMANGEWMGTIPTSPCKIEWMYKNVKSLFMRPAMFISVSLWVYTTEKFDNIPDLWILQDIDYDTDRKLSASQTIDVEHHNGGEGTVYIRDGRVKHVYDENIKVEWSDDTVEVEPKPVLVKVDIDDRYLSIDEILEKYQPDAS